MAGIIFVALALRPALVSLGPALVAIRNDFEMSHFAAGALISIPDLLMGLMALPTPWLMKKIGRDNLVFASLGLVAISTVARAYAPNIGFLLLYTAGVGTGIAIAGTILSGFVKANFPTRTAFVMGIYAASLSIGSTLSAFSTAPLLKVTGSWRIATGVWALPAVAGLVAWFIVKVKETKYVKSPIVFDTPKIPWKNGLAWRIAIFFACVNLIFYAMITWTASMFIENGLPGNIAGSILGFFTLIFTLSSFTIGGFSKSRDRRTLLIGSSQVTLVGFILMYFFTGAVAIVFVGIVAAGLGAAFTLAMTLPLDNTLDPDETNSWTAFVMTIGYLIAAAGPLLLGLIRDMTGDFKIPVLTLMGVSMGMILIGNSLKPRKLRFSDLYKRS